MLSAITEGSFANSPTTLSAGGQDEQPCDVNNSITARGSAATAGRTTATIAQTPIALDHREIELQAIITVIPDRGFVVAATRRYHLTDHKAISLRTGRTRNLGGPPSGRYSLRGEPPITITRRVCAAHTAKCRRFGSNPAHRGYRSDTAMERAAVHRRWIRSRRSVFGVVSGRSATRVWLLFRRPSGRSTARTRPLRRSAAARPCRPGWSDGCARSSGKSRHARQA